VWLQAEIQSGARQAAHTTQFGVPCRVVLDRVVIDGRKRAPRTLPIKAIAAGSVGACVTDDGEKKDSNPETLQSNSDNYPEDTTSVNVDQHGPSAHKRQRLQ
jgi:hypothetical protein